MIFSGLNFAGYLARKAVGAARGYGVTGILGGLVSSTAVTLQFSRLSCDEPALGTGLAIGVVGASSVLIPRVVFLSALLNYSVARALLPLLAPTFLVGAVITLVALWRQGAAAGVESDNQDDSPLRLWSAIRMTLAFQAALMAVEFVRTRLGSPGVLASAAFLGLTDMDALTLSMNRLGTTSELVALAARAIAVGIIANSVMKLGIILALGAPRYRQLAAMGLGALTLASVAALTLFW